MSYQERPVGLTQLEPWVACVWTRRTTGDPALVVPDGSIDLVWLGGRLQIMGPDTGPREVRLAPGTLVTGLRLLPGAARLLTGSVPASELTDEQVELASIWGAAASSDLTERVRSGDAGREMARALAGRLPHFEPDALVVAAARRLDAPQLPSIAGLAARLGISERQLRRRTIAAVGYGPKQLAQVLRLQRLQRVATDNWAHAAARAGYADQAHMTRQVKRLTGRTPTQLG